MEGAAASCESPKTTLKPKMKGIMLISALVTIPQLEGTNPPQPWDLTWMLVNGAAGEVISTTEHRAPLGTWWSDLFFCLRRINQGYRTLWGLGPYTPPDSAQGFYACPKTGESDACGWGPFWCASLDCVTSNDGGQKWPVKKRNAVKFSYVNQDVPRHVPRDKACDRDRDWVRIQFTEMGKNTEVSHWINGLT